MKSINSVTNRGKPSYLHAKITTCNHAKEKKIERAKKETEKRSTNVIATDRNTTDHAKNLLCIMYFHVFSCSLYKHSCFVNEREPHKRPDCPMREGKLKCVAKFKFLILFHYL